MYSIEMFKSLRKCPYRRRLLGESLHFGLLRSTTHRQQSITKCSLAKILIFGIFFNRCIFKSKNSFECSSLSTNTFTDQKPPKKLFFFFFYFF